MFVSSFGLDFICHKHIIAIFTTIVNSAYVCFLLRIVYN